MYKLLKDEEKAKIDLINSKLHGPEYLSKDLKAILEELDYLLGIEDAIIFMENGKIKRQEYIGKAEDLWKRYHDLIKEYTKKAISSSSYVSLNELNKDIQSALFIPIKENSLSNGAIIIFNKKLKKDQHNEFIIKIIESQIKLVFKKAKEREEVLMLFGQYVDKRQIAKILENPDFLKKPEMIDSVVLFADLEGFTKLINENNINEVFEFLNKVFYEFTKIINKNNGIVDKFVGDQVIGIFGIIDSENKEENSLKSSIELQKIMKKEFNKYNLGVKVAIVKDKLLYGKLGGKFKTDLTVIGKGVNLASRICEYAKRDEVLVNKELYNSLKEKYSFKLKDKKIFQGFNKEEEVYKLIE